MNKIGLFNYCLLILIVAFHFGCKDNSTEPEPANSAITGTVLFLDGTVGSGATVELQNMSNNSRVYALADVNGKYEFTDLKATDYYVRFKSTRNDILSFEKELSLLKDEILEQNVYIIYNMVDETRAVQKNKNVSLIKFQPDGAKIGSNYNLVNYLSGIYSGDVASEYTLACDIYKCPDNLDWFDADSIFTPENIKLNFEFITSLDETLVHGRHEIRFYENDIANILSNPINGFVLLNKNIDNLELKIPCVDFNNNDFGLKINYK